MSLFILRYLHCQSDQEANGGFTLLELLVSIIILGILATIALPSMLNQTFKAKQSIAIRYIGSVNRAQQVYRLEFPVFADSMNNLGINIALDTENYTFAFGRNSPTLAEFKASPKGNAISAYTGCTFQNIAGKPTTSILEQVANGTTPAVPPNC